MIRDLIAAHLLRFERPMRGSYEPATGARLLLAFVLVGWVLHPALLWVAGRFDHGQLDWVRPAIVLTLLAGVVVAMVTLVRADRGTIGLHPWRAWTPRERIYLLTVVPLAVVAFSIVFREHFARLVAIHGWFGWLAVSVPVAFLWGVVQELIYRGLLQTELVRRLGSVAGVLLANLAFTFGPLHYRYFGIGTNHPPRWDMFGAIFGIGLLFGILYRRSGNLWIPAILHGLWPLNMT
jgi:uncharacterized protein